LGESKLDIWPSIARADCLSRILGVLDSRGRSAVIAGESGTGTTRLARDAVDALAARGVSVVWLSASEAVGTVTAGPLADELHALSVDTRPASLLRLAVERLHGPGESGRLVVAIDNAELLDNISTGLVAQLVGRGVGVVATTRDPWTAARVARSLALSPGWELVRVEPLERAAVGELLASVLGDSLEPRTFELLWHFSQGYPAALNALVVGGREEGRLRVRDHMWTWRGPFVVSRAVALVEARLRGLSTEAEAAVAAVALGEPLSLAVAEVALGALALEALEERGILALERDVPREYLRLVRRLDREVVLDRLPSLRRRSLLVRLADALQQIGTRRAEDQLLTVEADLATRRPVDAGRLTAAARYACGRGRNGRAEELAVLALRRGGGAEALRASAEVRAARGQYASAAVQLAAIRERRDTDRLEIAALQFWSLGDAVKARAVLDGVPGPEATALRAAFAAYEGDPLAARRYAAGVTEGAPPSARARALLAEGLAEAVGGRANRGIDLVRRAATASDPASRMAREGTATAPTPVGLVPRVDEWLVAELLPLFLAGMWTEARARAEDAYWGSLHLGDPALSGLAAAFVGSAHLWLGHPRTALDWLREAVETLHDYDRSGLLSWALENAAWANSMVGDLEAAGATLERADAAARPTIRLLTPGRMLARAWLLQCDGESGKAVTLTEQAAQEATAAGQFAFALQAWQLWARIADPGRAAAALRVLPVEGPLARAVVTYIEGLATRDVDEIEAAGDLLEEQGMTVLATEALALAARLQSRAGLTSRARQNRIRAEALAFDFEGLMALQPQSSHDPAGLTRREREISTLAARGLSNREIASRLVVSTRTVENHLYRAYTKLGVSSRHELAVIMRSPPSDDAKRRTISVLLPQVRKNMGQPS
jgi:DNA-binding NarL/FixJ family response regulator